ncbi:uncharacterized protein LOC131254184 [Magnolia sinica]|uniref:uncharacterized protein LOC131254184 n=1 Tax=Magnolia sinica TaxID=86752 RepID=UPI00265922ED|nr:uncharacterized protein LOC131254184 [Magnolia sinica]
MTFIQELHKRGRLSPGLGAIFIALIPKVLGAASFREFRPISLIGGPDKILTKVLTSRLKKVIGKIILANQSAFIPIRQIMDCALIANECLHSCHKSGLKSIFCNLDIKKAYNHVDWNLLQYMLERMGFNPKWKEVSPDRIDNLRTTIWGFEAVSGLRVNLAKSKMYGVNLEEEELVSYALSFHCSSTSFLTTFTGLPLCLRPPAKSLWNKISNRFEKHLARWKCRYLSLGGRLTLIKAALSNLPLYFVFI